MIASSLAQWQVAAICPSPELQVGKQRAYDEIWELNLADAARIVGGLASEKAFRFHGLEIKLDEPAANWHPDRASRSQHLLLHQWHHLEPFLIHHSCTGTAESLALVARHMADWLDRFGGAFSRGDAPVDSFVAYGTAVARRLHRLSYVVEVQGKNDSAGQLAAAVAEHGLWLVNEKNFASSGNRVGDFGGGGRREACG